MRGDVCVQMHVLYQVQAIPRMQDAMLRIAISSCERDMRPHKKINAYSIRDPSMIYCALHELASARGVFLLPVHEKIEPATCDNRS